MSDFLIDELNKYVPGNLSRLLTDIDSMAKVARIALVPQATPTDGGLASFKNPYDEVITVYTILNVTTPTSGAATADIGVGTVAATDDDTLHDGTDIGTAAIDEFSGAGTNGVLNQNVAANGFVAATASADSLGIVGTLTVFYWKTVEPLDGEY